MPGTITSDFTTVDAADAATDWLTLGTIAAGPTANADMAIQGSNALANRISAAAGPITQEAYLLAANAGTPGSFDLTINQRHVYIWVKCITWPGQNTKANGGLRVSISSDATPTLSGTTPSDGPTNSKTWYVDGNDTETVAGWICYVVDPQGTADLVIGSATLTAVKRVGMGTSTIHVIGAGSFKPDNIIVDICKYGSGLTINNGTAGAPVAFADILAADSSNANAFGVITQVGGIYFGAGKLNFGTTGQAAITYFSDTNEVLSFQNFPVAATFYEILTAGAAGFTTTFQLGNFSGGVASGGCTVTAAGSACWTLTASGANTTTNLYACSLSRMKQGSLNSTCAIRSCTIANSGALTPNGATVDSTIFQSVVTTAPISASWALIINAPSELAAVTNCKFISCNKAIKITAAGTYTLSGCTFAGNTFDIENSSTGAVIINATNGSNPVTVLNSNGGTTTINNAVTLQVTCQDVLGNAIKNARVAIYKSTDVVSGHELLSGLTNASGVVSGSFAFAGNQAIIVRVRAETPAIATPTNAAFSSNTTGGTLSNGTYSYRVSATNDIGETLASTETSLAISGGTSTQEVVVNWTTVPDATGYRVYGRSAGTELFIAAVSGGSTSTYTDTGTITPSGTLPSSNTTGTGRYVPVDSAGTITSAGYASLVTLIADTVASSTAL